MRRWVPNHVKKKAIHRYATFIVLVGCLLLLNSGSAHWGRATTTTEYSFDFLFLVHFSGRTQGNLTARTWAIAEGSSTEIVIAPEEGQHTPVPWVIYDGLLTLYESTIANSNLTLEAYFAVCPHLNGTVIETPWPSYYLVPSEGYYQAPNGSQSWFSTPELVTSLNASLQWGPHNMTGWRWNGTYLYENVAFKAFFDAELPRFVGNYSLVENVRVEGGYLNPDGGGPNWVSLFEPPAFTGMIVTDPPGAGRVYLAATFVASEGQEEQVRACAAALIEDFTEQWYIGKVWDYQLPGVPHTATERTGFAFGPLIGVSLLMLIRKTDRSKCKSLKH